jgi:hypothetical protein
MRVESEAESEQMCRLDNGELIRILIDDFGLQICVTNEDGDKMGSIELKENPGGSYHLMWMYLDQAGDRYKRKGIGRQCLLFHKSIYGALFTATEDNGMRMDDGSHLTGDAPAFVQALQSEGLIIGGQDPYAAER